MWLFVEQLHDVVEAKPVIAELVSAQCSLGQITLCILQLTAQHSELV
jgi:hypothetical protein